MYLNVFDWALLLIMVGKENFRFRFRFMGIIKNLRLDDLVTSFKLIHCLFEQKEMKNCRM